MGAIAGGEQTFTEVRMQATLAQVQQVLRMLAPGMRRAVVDTGVEAAERAGKDAIGYLLAADRQFKGVGTQPLALDEALVLDAAKEGAKASVLRRLLGTQTVPPSRSSPADLVAVTPHGNVPFVPHPSSKNRRSDVTMMVDTHALDRAWSKDGDFYIGRDEKGIEGRRAGVVRFLGTKQPLQASRVGFDETGRAMFGDGRHRFATLRDHGADKMAITVDKQSLQHMPKDLLTGAPPEARSAASAGILQRYGENVIEHFEQELRIAVVTRKPWDEVRTALKARSSFLQGAPAHWAERIARTEIAGAYNRATGEAHAKADEELGDLLRVLSATFDKRTGPDSKNVHGQVRRTGEPFEYVDYKGARSYFADPPNRPNDREVVVGHRLSWPIPKSLQPLSDGEVRAAYVEAKQRFHGRPRLMSTVTGLTFA